MLVKISTIIDVLRYWICCSLIFFMHEWIDFSWFMIKIISHRPQKNYLSIVGIFFFFNLIVCIPIYIYYLFIYLVNNMQMSKQILKTIFEVWLTHTKYLYNYGQWVFFKLIFNHKQLQNQYQVISKKPDVVKHFFLNQVFKI